MKKLTRIACISSLAIACAMPVVAQTSGSGSSGAAGITQANDSDMDWGWIGLLGLMGLLGLRGKDKNRR